MVFSVSDIKLLLERYQGSDLRSAPMAFHNARSALIAMIRDVYDKKIGDGESGFDKKYYPHGLFDSCLASAERIVISDASNPYFSLRLLALDYVYSWDIVLRGMKRLSLAEDTQEVFIQQVQNFVHAHLNFLDRYIEAMKIHKRDTHLGVQLNFPKTLMLFYSSIILFIHIYPDSEMKLKALIQDHDAETFLLIPSIVIFILSTQDATCPELLEKFETDIEELQEAYKKLKPLEQKALGEWLLDDKITLSAECEALYLKIQKIAYSLHDKSLALSFSRCIRTLVAELNDDFLTAEQFKKEWGNRPSVQPNLSGVLFALLHLSSASMERIIPFIQTSKGILDLLPKFQNSEGFREEVQEFLYDEKTIDSDPVFMEKLEELRDDLENAPKLYRLFGIMQLVFRI